MLSTALLLFSLLPLSAVQPFGDGNDAPIYYAAVDDLWDDFDGNPEEALVFDPADDGLCYSGVRRMAAAAISGDTRKMEEAAAEIEAAAAAGCTHAQSALGFMYSMGMMRERNGAKAFLYHSFAADGGNMQSKMALAYMYSSQQMFDKAIGLYAELAEVAVKSLLISKDSLVRIHDGAEEDKESLRKSLGEESEDFRILEYHSQNGDAEAMYKIGMFYYLGLRGVRCDHAKALSWLLKAVEKGESRSMELLGQIYARGVGVGVERNYTRAFEWLTLASRQELCEAYTGMGYLYAKGYGAEKNYSKAKEYFEKAADNGEPGGYYYLGVMYLKGIGIERNVKLAVKYFIQASNAGQQEALYQLAKMFHSGLGLKKNLQMAIALHKIVAEQGPWGSLSRWALESYLKGNVGNAFLLYLRMAELGYEVAQSNAAWILDKYGERCMCVGESGLCTDAERHQRAYSLWWQASKQGNEYATSLITGANYTGRETQRNESVPEGYVECPCNALSMFNQLG